VLIQRVHVLRLDYPTSSVPSLIKPKLLRSQLVATMLPSIEAKAFEVETIISYTFTEKHLAAEATQMAAPEIAAISNNAFNRLNNNKRLSILGEAVLARELCSAWFKQRTSRDGVLSPAQWTQLRNDIISNDALARRGYTTGVDNVVIKAPSTPTLSSRMVATAVAAIIGAVHEDGGDDAVHSVMQHLGFFDHALLTVTSQLLPLPP
jgi:ribonuclease-3